MRIIYYDMEGNIHKYIEQNSYSENAILPTIEDLQKNTELQVVEIKDKKINGTNWQFMKFTAGKISKRKDKFLTPDELILKNHMDNEVEKRNKLKDGVKLAGTIEEKVLAIEKYLDFTGDELL